MCSPSPPCPSQVDDSTHTHLPNIETSSQLLEPDQSLTGRQEIDVTYAKVSKAQRKRRAAVTGSRPAPHSSIPVKCKRMELEEVFPMVQPMIGGGAVGVGEECSVWVPTHIAPEWLCPSGKGWGGEGIPLLWINVSHHKYV